MRIALAGNPNSGKTTLFNALTGRNEHVGNWAGVTVSKNVGALKSTFSKMHATIEIVDLPGAYSMSPYTSEESITRDFVKGEKPDVIINIVDATNLSRSLFFTTQLLELEIPVVIALNKSDLTAKKQNQIQVEKLSYALGCPIVETISTSGSNNGLDKLIEEAIKRQGEAQVAPFGAPGLSESNEFEAHTIDTKRYAFVKEVVGKFEVKAVASSSKNRQDAIDGVVAHKVLGIPIFLLVMWAVFSISQTYLGPFLADLFVGWIDQFYAFVAALLGESVSPVLSALLLDGIIGGVGLVVGFLPLIMVLFFLLALLEDSGYMSRVAVIMDRFFKKVGLSGKSIIPMVIGTGCSIPGVMATRTIKNERQRRTTAMLTPFMPCGAKLPVIALFAGVFFDNAGWVGTLMYFVGIAIIILGAFIVQRIAGEPSVRSYFIMELPEYRFPSVKRAFMQMLMQGKSFVVKAGTIILICNAAVHIMQSFTWQFQVVEEGLEATSILASLANPFAFVLIPLGFGAWQLAAAAITGFIAKENVVGTLAVVYGITNFIDTEALEVVSGTDSIAAVMGLTSVTALSYLMFNLFTPPCFAAIGAMNAEMESRAWLWGGIAFQFGMGYTVSFLVYQIGTLITTGSVGIGFIPGAVFVAVLVSLVLYMMQRNKRSLVANQATA